MFSPKDEGESVVVVILSSGLDDFSSALVDAIVKPNVINNLVDRDIPVGQALKELPKDQSVALLVLVASTLCL